MEQASSKHRPRLDEQLAGDVRGETQGRPGGRAEEWHLPEPPGEDQPDTASRSNAVSRLGRYIGLAALPGDREALRRSAAMLNAPDDIIAALDRLPRGVVFDTVAEVQRTLSGAVSHPTEARPPNGTASETTEARPPNGAASKTAEARPPNGAASETAGARRAREGAGQGQPPGGAGG